MMVRSHCQMMFLANGRAVIEEIAALLVRRLEEPSLKDVVRIKLTLGGLLCGLPTYDALHMVACEHAVPEVVPRE
jgi:hypothetical protein